MTQSGYFFPKIRALFSKIYLIDWLNINWLIGFHSTCFKNELYSYCHIRAGEIALKSMGTSFVPSLKHLVEEYLQVFFLSGISHCNWEDLPILKLID